MRAIAGDAAFARQPLQQRLLLTPQLHQRSSRRAASTAAAQQDVTRDAFDEDIEFDEVPQAPERERAVVTPLAVQLTKRAKGIEIENKKALDMELRYLKDPLKLSEHVKYTLRCNKPNKALDLCRLASKTMSCVVSWNAIIDWLMRANKINEALKAAANGPMKGVLDFTDQPLVSSDFNHYPASSTVDSLETAVLEGKLARVVSWYDNEWGFSNRMIDTAGVMAKFI